MAKEKIGSNAIFSGPQLGLSIVGEHCYALSGTFQSLNAAATMLEFTTPSRGYIIGKLQCNGSVRIADSDSGDTTAFQISFNGIVVAVLKTETGLEDMPPTVTQTFVIPPSTTVQIVRDGTADNVNNLNTVGFTGRVYV